MNIEEFKKNVTDKKIKDLCYFYKRNETDRNSLVNNMVSLAIFMKDKFNLDIYLVYGTLLGVIRENDFIAHDNDIDLAYLSNKNNAKDVLDEFYKISSTLKEYKMLSRLCDKGQMHVYSPNRTHKYDMWTSWIAKDKFYLSPLFDGDVDSSIIIH